VTDYVHSNDHVVGPPDFLRGRRPTTLDGIDKPRPTPVEWARLRRERKTALKATAARDRAKNRLSRLGAGWHLIDSARLGLAVDDSFLAIGPGGIFAVTVKTQGRGRVLISGDVVQINGRRPDYLGEARRFADAVGGALSRTAGTSIPVTPILAFAGSGLLSLYGLPRRCLVMPYRELDHLLRSYGERIASRTVEKLASIARHPVTSIDLQSIGPSKSQSGQRRAG
jgi:hypothetical protein